jgi:hypothetical protein
MVIMPLAIIAEIALTLAMGTHTLADVAAHPGLILAIPLLWGTAFIGLPGLRYWSARRIGDNPALGGPCDFGLEPNGLEVRTGMTECKVTWEVVEKVRAPIHQPALCLFPVEASYPFRRAARTAEVLAAAYLSADEMLDSTEVVKE